MPDDAQGKLRAHLLQCVGKGCSRQFCICHPCYEAHRFCTGPCCRDMEWQRDRGVHRQHHPPGGECTSQIHLDYDDGGRRRVEDSQDVAVFQQSCRGEGCGRVFFVCQSCYRGQLYCSEPCRAEAKRRKGRERSAKYRKNKEKQELNRMNAEHRRRSRERRREGEQKVSDAAPRPGSTQDTLAPRTQYRVEMEMSMEMHEEDGMHSPHGRPLRVREMVCQLCGRPVVLIGIWEESGGAR